ncbi:MAG TPA: hypothetical protein VE033_06645 [Acetobacteraceae bacterium]|jgi:hypothetical protein|nr:hypothetical protein [Acetobacteraceae bacterium]
MNASAIYFMMLAVATALAGLLTAAFATAPAFGLFGWGLLAFGVLFALGMVKRHFDAVDGH